MSGLAAVISDCEKNMKHLPFSAAAAGTFDRKHVAPPSVQSLSLSALRPQLSLSIATLRHLLMQFIHRSMMLKQRGAAVCGNIEPHDPMTASVVDPSMLELSPHQTPKAESTSSTEPR